MPGPTCSVNWQSSTLARPTLQSVVGEVQSGRRRRHGTRHLGVDRLIVLAVVLDHLPLADIRRQRHAAHSFQSANVSSIPQGRAIQVPPGSLLPSSSCTSSSPVAFSSVTVSPGLSVPRVLQRICHRPLGLASRNSPSQCPPELRRRPTSRAGTTRVSLITRQSFCRRISGRSRMWRCSNDFRCRSTTSNRASDRQAAGDWAIKSFGKS